VSNGWERKHLGNEGVPGVEKEEDRHVSEARMSFITWIDSPLLLPN
jgi:hypothetical protein